MDEETKAMVETFDEETKEMLEAFYSMSEDEQREWWERAMKVLQKYVGTEPQTLEKAVLEVRLFQAGTD